MIWQAYHHLPKKSLDRLLAWRYEQFHRREAALRLRTIEQQNGKTDPKLIRQCKDYAADVLGWQGYAPWLVAYTALAGEFREGWIPDNYFGRVVLPHLNGANKFALTNRVGAKHLFKTDAFPDIGAISNGLLFDGEGNIVDPEAFKKRLFNGHDKVIFKLDLSYGSEGRYIMTRDALDLPLLRQKGNGVFQYYIDQHPFFAQYTPDTCATLRLSTLIDNDGMCRVRAAWVKFERVEPFHTGPDSHIRIMVDPMTGTLGEHGYFDSWRKVDGYPDCDLPTKGQNIPHFAECVALVTSLHLRAPYARWLGWDVIVDSQGEVKIMECNGRHADGKLNDVLQGPLFTDMGWENLWRK